MYSHADRIRAVELYINLGKRIKATIRQLGYPTKNALKGWCRKYEQHLELRSRCAAKTPKYSEAQKLAAVQLLSRAHERLARDVEVILESLTVYVKYDFMLTAHMAEPDRVAHAKGTERFNRFIDTVARSLVKPEPTDGEPTTNAGEIPYRIGGQ